MTAPIPPPPPPPEDKGSVALGCVICFLVVLVGGYMTLGLSRHYPFNLLPPLFGILVLSINIARTGWTRTHTGILIGLLLTVGAFMLLMSICGRGF